MKLLHVKLSTEHAYKNDDIADMLDEIADQVRVIDDNDGKKHKGELMFQGQKIGEWSLEQASWQPKKYA